MQPRLGWMGACALAVIGAFFLALQILWLLKVEPEWLPFVVQPVGAACAGLVLARVAPVRSLLEPLLGGVLGLAVLVAISYRLPRAFVLTAAGIDPRWLIVPGVIAASGLACAAGGWLAAGVQGGRAWIAMLAAMVAACTILLGGRVVYALGVAPELTTVAIEVAAFGLAAGAVAQAIATVNAAGACAAGTAATIAVVAAGQLSTGAKIDATSALMLLPIFTAALGAHMVPRDGGRS